MRKLALVFISIFIACCTQAQIVIGTIDPSNALSQMGEYQTIIKRLESSENYKRMIYTQNSINNQIQKQTAQLKEASSAEEAQRIQASIKYLQGEMNRSVRPMLMQFEERKKQLTQSLVVKLNAAIEEIALEEACGLILNPALISDDFKEYIGEGNFIDITTLVVERVAEK